MADYVVRQDLGPVIQLHFHQCANCGAFLEPDTKPKFPTDADHGAEICDDCALAQPGADELI